MGSLTKLKIDWMFCASAPPTFHTAWQVSNSILQNTQSSHCWLDTYSSDSSTLFQPSLPVFCMLFLLSLFFPLFHIFLLFCEVFILALLYLSRVWRMRKRKHILEQTFMVKVISVWSQSTLEEKKTCIVRVTFSKPLECILLPESRISSLRLACKPDYHRLKALKAVGAKYLSVNSMVFSLEQTSHYQSTVSDRVCPRMFGMCAESEARNQVVVFGWLTWPLPCCISEQSRYIQMPIPELKA